jgi:hypothetical protein
MNDSVSKLAIVMSENCSACSFEFAGMNWFAINTKFPFGGFDEIVQTINENPRARSILR